MKTNTLVYPLGSVPTRNKLQTFVQQTVLEFAGDVPYSFRISQTIPENQPEYITDQLKATKRDRPDSVFLVIDMEN